MGDLTKMQNDSMTSLKSNYDSRLSTDSSIFSVQLQDLEAAHKLALKQALVIHESQIKQVTLEYAQQLGSLRNQHEQEL